MRLNFGLFVLLSLLAACAAPRRAEHFYRKNLRREILSSPVFAKSFTGFVLMDAASGRVLCDVNGDHYFTPASDTKILTLATCLAVLGDSVPGLQYQAILEDASDEHPWRIGWCFRGTGDPTFLHPAFQYWQPAARLLRTGGLLVYDERRFQESRLGAGWAWDDYNEDFSAERSALPIHGNLVHLQRDPNPCSNGWIVEPAFFQPFLQAREDYKLNDRDIHRDESSDTISLPYYHSETFEHGFECDLPVWNARDKTLPLLMDRLDLHDPIEQGWCGERYQTLYSTPIDTVLRRMMFQSDNFIAEQMLLVSAGVKFDTLDQDPMIQWAKDSLFTISNFQFPISPASRPPRWVDGSGLSRYNLATPKYLAGVLRGLWRTQPRERLFSLFPTAGAPQTTLDWWQPVPPEPWLYAKTGSMSGVQCISGYLVTRRGKVLIFSFMNNNFVGPGRPWKEEMRRILEIVHER